MRKLFPRELSFSMGILGVALVGIHVMQTGLSDWNGRISLLFLGHLACYSGLICIGWWKANRELDPYGLKDPPFLYQGVVVNSTGRNVLVVNFGNHAAAFLPPGRASDSSVDSDILADKGQFIKIGPNKIRLHEDGTIVDESTWFIRRTRSLLGEGPPRPASQEEIDAAKRILRAELKLFCESDDRNEEKPS